jgi:hypothetical protein
VPWWRIIVYVKVNGKYRRERRRRRRRERLNGAVVVVIFNAGPPALHRRSMRGKGGKESISHLSSPLVVDGKACCI